MKKSFFRIIVVVFLVCALLVSWSPIQVKANSLAVAGSAFLSFLEAGAAAAGTTVFGYVAIGLGLTFSAVKLVEVVNEYIEYSGELETSIYYYADGTWTYGVDMTFVEQVREFMFHNGVVSSSGGIRTFVPEGAVYFEATTETDCVGLRWANYYEYSDMQYAVRVNNYLVAIEPGNQWPTAKKATSYVTSADGKHYLYNLGSSTGYISKGSLESYMASKSPAYVCLPGEYSLQDMWDMWGESEVIGSEGVEIDTVVPLEVPMPDAYPEWYGNARPAVSPETGEEVMVLPVPYNPTADPDAAPGVLTQPDIWQGSIADPMPGIGTIPDVSIAETPWVAVKKWVSDFFIPSGDITMYSLDLTELFPFCIPFDLFDLLSALRADPVAPVFELELDFGITKAPIVVDLSGWSDLASIVRILEVGLFCIGLALGTKELIGS